MTKQALESAEENSEIDAIDPDSYLGEEVEAVEVEAEAAEELNYTPLEEEAMKDGWTRKDEWDKAGKDSERWKSAHEFVSYGKLKSAMDETKRAQDELKADFDKRLENINKMHKAETDQKIKALKAQQRTAIKEADIDEHDELQKQIDDIESVDKTPPAKEKEEVPDRAPEITAWEAKNTWINDPNDPKAQATYGLWNGYVQANPNSTNAQALEYIDKQLETLGLVKPLSNARREAPAETERTAIVPAKNTGKLTMNDLTQEEKGLWRDCGQDIWEGNQKAFLQSMKDGRK